MKLFQPAKIGQVELKNRLIMAPMSLNLARDGFVTEPMIRFFEERARGGVALIVLGDGIVDHPLGNNSEHSIAIDDDKYLPALRELTRRAKRHGAKMCINLSHGGRRAGRVAKSGYLEVTKGKIPVAPSPVAHPAPGFVVPRELTIEEIEELVEKFGRAAGRAVDAGFDIIGFHCAHMYLGGQFLSPWANKRKDKYGGDLAGRFNFAAEVIGRIKREVGVEHPLMVRMNVEEPEGGNTFEEIKLIAQKMDRAGVDAISVSIGFGAVSREYPVASAGPMRAPDACLASQAEEIKRMVSVPVILADKVRTAHIAEAILEAGKADLIAIGRPLIADPEFVMKSAGEAFEDIVPCIYCNRCVQSLSSGSPAYCTVNPVACREAETVTSPASAPKKVVVIGGGPAGMEAAIVAARRGHSVSLYEKQQEPGGQLLLAVKPPGKANIRPLLDYFRGQVRKLGIKMEPGREATVEDVAKQKPDVVIAATGGAPTMPPIPGVNGKNVVTAWQVLGGADTGKRVVIIGGGQLGAETSEYLAEQGKSVTVVEMLGELAAGMPEMERWPLLLSLERLGVAVITRGRAERISDGKVVVSRLGRETELPADGVVLATGIRPSQEMAVRLQGRVPEVIAIGDAKEPRRILEAVREGFEAGNRI
ncbi:MAG: FAD-dependent oxidoreductase [Chloroflexi bacterium]|nr:FAD-dependent oxidoreductase [Chloroflexota bacterium]